MCPTINLKMRVRSSWREISSKKEEECRIELRLRWVSLQSDDKQRQSFSGSQKGGRWEEREMKRVPWKFKERNECYERFMRQRRPTTEADRWRCNNSEDLILKWFPTQQPIA